MTRYVLFADAPRPVKPGRGRPPATRLVAFEQVSFVRIEPSRVVFKLANDEYLVVGHTIANLMLDQYQRLGLPLLTLSDFAGWHIPMTEDGAVDIQVLLLANAFGLDMYKIPTILDGMTVGSYDLFPRA